MVSMALLQLTYSRFKTGSRLVYTCKQGLVLLYESRITKVSRDDSILLYRQCECKTSKVARCRLSVRHDCTWNYPVCVLL